MCGRIAQTTSIERIIQLTNIAGKLESVPQYNIAPSMKVLGIVGSEQKGNFWQEFQWGLIPSWAKDLRMGFKTFNAKAETVAEKPAYRAAFKKRRCLIPVDGFYEWYRAEKAKVPYFIHARDGSPLLLAGLWEVWSDNAGTTIFSCTIITTEANRLLAEIHDRMPVIIDVQDLNAWLYGTGRADLESLLRPSQDGRLEKYRVTARMNNTRYAEPDCMMALD